MSLTIVISSCSLSIFSKDEIIRESLCATTIKHSLKLDFCRR
jgi:hypothetical protein